MPLTSTRRKGRTVAACALTGLLAVATAACGGASSGASSPASSAGALATRAGVSYADGQLATYSKLLTSFKAPGPSLSGLKQKLSGKSVWYVPVFLQAPIFSADAKALAEPLKLVGASLHVCDAGSNPSQGDSCIKQAVAAHAAAIVTDAINYSFAPKATDAALAAGIPVIPTNNDEPQGFPANKLLHSVSTGLPQTFKLAADAIIADSKGKADVLYAADNSDDGKIDTTATMAEFTAHCPACTVTTVTFGDLSVQHLATGVSAAMAAHPKIDYVFGGYDAPSGIFALQGAKTVAGRKFTYVAATGQPPGLQRVAAGQQSADPGLDPDANMWNTADALFRVVDDSAPVSYPPALRIFTKQNVPSNTNDASAYASGQWYSNGSFKAMYKTLWGL